MCVYKLQREDISMRVVTVLFITIAIVHGVTACILFYMIGVGYDADGYSLPKCSSKFSWVNKISKWNKFREWK